MINTLGLISCVCLLLLGWPLGSCQRRQGWRNGNQNGNHNGFPPKQSNGGHQSSWNSPIQGDNSQSCPRPEFEDDSDLIIDRCKTDKFHAVCTDPNSNIPGGWKVFMGCKRRRKQYLFPSTCSRQGEWQPKLYNSCEALLNVFPQIGTNSNSPNKSPVTAYTAPNPDDRNPPSSSTGRRPQQRPDQSTSDEMWDTDVTSFHTGNPASPLPSALKKCPMLYMKLTDNFVFTCSIPGEQESNDCLTTRKTVPSGSIATLKCKPPFYSSDGKTSEWKCTDGTWFGDFNYRLKCYYSQNNPPPTSTSTSTTTSSPPVYLPYDPSPSVDPQEPHVIPYQKEPYVPEPYVPEPPTTTTTPTPTTTSTLRPPASPHIRGVCPPLSRHKEGIVLECVYKTSDTVTLNRCETLQPEGAEAKYTCAKHYESTAGLVTLYRKCKSDGSWSGSAEGFNCVIECGRNNEVFTPFIVSGSPSMKGQWPWHSAIYLKETIEVTEKKWTYICGGTLISKFAIATAAHCVTFSESPRVRNASHFKIDLGRFHLDETDDFVQAKDVASVHVHPSYSPYGYDSDIALVILKESVTIGHHVRPICFPQTLNSALEELQVSESSAGTVVGWGYTEENVISNTLLMAELKVASQRDCSESETGRIQPKSTTYCARARNGTTDINVCRGDSGGGMYFPLKNTDFTRWYLQGLVSVGRLDSQGKCKASQYSIFTRVGRYADWIVRVLSEQEALR